MRIALLSLVTLLGCGSNDDSPGGGNPRPDARPPIDAGTFVDATIDAPIVEDDDPDRDNVKTPVDNCPTVANPLQANDDADGRGDACDTCPWKAGESTVDGDGDGLTDDCDPDPRYADELVYFEGFDKLSTDQVLPAGWAAITTAGSWSVSTQNGTLTGSHPPDGGAPALLAKDLGPTSSTDRLYVRAAGLFGDGVARGQAGIAGDIDASGATPAGAFCDLTLDASKTVAGFFRGSDSSEEGEAVGALTTPVALRLIVDRAAPHRVRCDAKGRLAGSAVHSDDPTDRTGTSVGLRVSDGTAVYRYIAVLRLHPMTQPPAAPIFE